VLSVGNVCIAGKPAAFEGCSRPSDDGTVALADASSRGVPGHPLQVPDLVAPGSFVTSARATLPGYYSASPDYELTGACGANGLEDFRHYMCIGGTSMSAPHVAGVLALMEEAVGRDLTPAELYKLVISSARPVPPLQQWEAGAGMLDAVAAVRAARELVAREAGAQPPGRGRPPGRGPKRG
jgi:subtilisin family serine protease